MPDMITDMMHQPKTVDELLLEFKSNKQKDDLSNIKFIGMGEEKDIYNITAPFLDNGERYIAGRVESRDSEDSRVLFFQKTEEGWKAATDMPVFILQDPFAVKVKGQLVFGGVEVFDDAERPGTLNYRTVFYKGTSISNLKLFAKGPERMKDIRICGLLDGRILVMTRPQGALGGRGKIGYIIIDSLEDLNPEMIQKAKILQNQFILQEWGGCNELHLLSGTKVGILSHIAKYGAKGERHYYATAFCFDYEKETYSQMRIIAVRDNFADGPAKREDLTDVIFSGGLVRDKNLAHLYCGVSDTQGHTITIDDPFIPFETEDNITS